MNRKLVGTGRFFLPPLSPTHSQISACSFFIEPDQRNGFPYAHKEVWENEQSLLTAFANPRHAFGIKADVQDNIHYIDDATVVYPVGRSVVIYNTQSNTQKFINASEKTGVRCTLHLSIGALFNFTDAITALAVSPNKKYIAVAESGETPCVSIYDSTTRKRKKFLSVPDLGSRVSFHSPTLCPPP